MNLQLIINISPYQRCYPIINNEIITYFNCITSILLLPFHTTIISDITYSDITLLFKRKKEVTLK